MSNLLHIPPQISSTRTENSIGSRFDDESAMMNSVSLGRYRSASAVRIVEVLEDWRGPSFKQLAAKDPAQLLDLVRSSRLAAHDLTFAAEAAGLIKTSPKVVDVLLPLLQHDSPLVREGAVYGLSHHLEGQEWVRMRLEHTARHDPSPGVRDAATEALDDK